MSKSSRPISYGVSISSKAWRTLSNFAVAASRSPLWP
jgi:hypothetical protein